MDRLGLTYTRWAVVTRQLVRLACPAQLCARLLHFVLTSFRSIIIITVVGALCLEPDPLMALRATLWIWHVICQLVCILINFPWNESRDCLPNFLVKLWWDDSSIKLSHMQTNICHVLQASSFCLANAALPIGSSRSCYCCSTMLIVAHKAFDKLRPIACSHEARKVMLCLA